MQRTIGAALLALGATNVASAHHGIANFDLNKDIALEGVVTRVDFVNPHSWLHFDVTAADGTVTNWRCEMRGATVLRRSGWEPEMFPAGMRIKVTGSPDRREATTCYLGTAIFPDGSSVDRYGQRGGVPATLAPPADRPARLANGDPNIAGDWASEQRVMTDPRGQSGTLVPLSTADRFAPGAVPEGGQAFPGARGTAVSLADDPVDTYWNRRPSALPLTEAGKKAIEGFDGSSADNPRLACKPTNILFDWTFEADINRITQTPERIEMFYGAWGIARTIHLNETSHPPRIEPSVAGHSIGRWENDVLIVDTVGFAPGILLADGRVPHSGKLHVVERFTLDPQRGALARSYIADDSEYLVGTHSGADTVFLASLPYHGTTECQELTVRPPDDAAPQAAPASRPWWKFWD